MASETWLKALDCTTLGQLDGPYSNLNLVRFANRLSPLLAAPAIRGDCDGSALIGLCFANAIANAFDCDCDECLD